ncbi:hypothetical protein SKAU_G00393070 [Synaphobranchus kaupii]|uniref:NAD(P)(+)--arginine ADP-ribosyltransferase n=1 Tax=Synaphobranchus kaupii TaxID=118154 RepID=A0A9Q1EBX9_SYNKA|nr:hypothetical protein SKAU_G00393070 [Synaphobranchus kaupii]
MRHLTTGLLLVAAIASGVYTDTRGRCRTVYSLSRVGRPRAIRGSEVRLGYFSVASTKFLSMFDMTVRTCHGVELPPSSCSLGWRKVLVPPFEQFKVVAVKRKLFYLESTGTRSYLNCAFYRQVHPTSRRYHTEVPNPQPPNTP